MNHNDSLKKEIKVLPTEGKVIITLDEICDPDDMIFIDNSLIITPFAVYVETIYEDDLDWGKNGLVSCLFMRVNDETQYNVLSTRLNQEYIFVAEVPLNNKIKSTHISCVSDIADLIDPEESFSVDPNSTKIKISIYKNKAEKATHLVVLLKEIF